MNSLLARVNSVRGIVHVGAHYGQEGAAYASLGVSQLCWIEPQSYAFARLAANAAPGAVLLNCALGERAGTRDLYSSANEGQSSSLLPPKLHLQEHPDVCFTGREQVLVRRLADLPLDFRQFNLLVMDVQGAELEVLKGGESVLHFFDYIIAEVQNIELYENCALLPVLDSWLANQGFVRDAVEWHTGSWGDALYIKKAAIE
jgi:FkbM family methyltransferase